MDMASKRPSARPEPQTYARVGGIAYLAITLSGALGVAWLDACLLVEDDLQATVESIRGHLLSFRLGAVSVVVIYASVLVASWALFVLLAPVSRTVSLLALIFRSAEAMVGFATILTSLLVAQLVTPGGPATALGEATIAAWVGVALAWRTAALDVVLALVGVGAALFFLLFWHARLIPRWLAVSGVFTYASMLCLALVSLLYVDHPTSLESMLYTLGAAFEAVFGFWMVWKGVDAERWHGLSASDPRPRAAT